MKPMTSTQIAIIVVLALVAAGAVVYALGNNPGAVSPGRRGPMNFEECAAAGNPIMESYPRQCRTADGRTFVEEVNAPAPPPSGSSKGGCMPAGCSGVVCAEEDEAANIVTTCEYRAEYACYRLTKCERQTTGKCGWTETSAFTACLSNPPPLQ